MAALLGVLLVSVLSGAWLPAGAQAADSQLDVPAAQGAFATADQLCHADAGHLWGVSLCGRIMVAAPGTRAYVGLSDGVLSQGALPDEVAIGNTLACTGTIRTGS